MRIKLEGKKTRGHSFLPEHKVSKAANSKEQRNSLRSFHTSAPLVVREASRADPGRMCSSRGTAGSWGGGGGGVEYSDCKEPPLTTSATDRGRSLEKKWTSLT